MSAAGQAAMEKWKTQPIGGEIRPELWGQIFDEKPANPHTQNFAECVRQTHVTWLMDTGMFRELAAPRRRDRAISLVRRMGYDFYVQSAEILPAADGKVSVSLEVVNQGVAPFYHDWSLEIGLLSAEGKSLRTWPVDWKLVKLLPGDPPRRWRSVIDLESLRASGGIVAVRVLNPLPGGKPLRFRECRSESACRRLAQRGHNCTSSERGALAPEVFDLDIRTQARASTHQPANAGRSPGDQHLVVAGMVKQKSPRTYGPWAYIVWTAANYFLSAVSIASTR